MPAVEDKYKSPVPYNTSLILLDYHRLLDASRLPVMRDLLTYVRAPRCRKLRIASLGVTDISTMTHLLPSIRSIIGWEQSLRITIYLRSPSVDLEAYTPGITGVGLEVTNIGNTLPHLPRSSTPYLSTH